MPMSSSSRRSSLALLVVACAGVTVPATIGCSSSSPAGSDDIITDDSSVPKKRAASPSSSGTSQSGPETSAPSTTTPVSPATDPDAGVADADTTPAPPAPPAPPAATPCGPAGAGVFASVDASSAWRYSTSSDVAPGFASRGLAFRLAPADTAEPHATLYLLRSDKYADYLVTTVPSEGSGDGYGPIAVLGTVYLTELPGTVPLTRYYQTSPALRHQVSIDGPVGGWDPEPPRGYVCPR